jgi:hypothetical protein
MGNATLSSKITGVIRNTPESGGPSTLFGENHASRVAQRAYAIRERYRTDWGNIPPRANETYTEMFNPWSVMSDAWLCMPAESTIVDLYDVMAYMRHIVSEVVWNDPRYGWNAVGLDARAEFRIDTIEQFTCVLRALKANVGVRRIAKVWDVDYDKLGTEPQAYMALLKQFKSNGLLALLRLTRGDMNAPEFSEIFGEGLGSGPEDPGTVWSTSNANKALTECIRKKYVSPAALKQHLVKNTKWNIESLTYSNTPSEMVDKLIDLLQLSYSDVFVDIGSGIGSVVMLVNRTIGCRKCIGIEIVPERHLIAEELNKALGLKNDGVIEWIHGDFREGTHSAAIQEGTAFYVDNTHFSNPDVHGMNPANANIALILLRMRVRARLVCRRNVREYLGPLDECFEITEEGGYIAFQKKTDSWKCPVTGCPGVQTLHEMKSLNITCCEHFAVSKPVKASKPTPIPEVTMEAMQNIEAPAQTVLMNLNVALEHIDVPAPAPAPRRSGRTTAVINQPDKLPKKGPIHNRKRG